MHWLLFSVPHFFHSLLHLFISFNLLLSPDSLQRTTLATAGVFFANNTCVAGVTALWSGTVGGSCFAPGQQLTVYWCFGDPTRHPISWMGLICRAGRAERRATSCCICEDNISRADWTSAHWFWLQKKKRKSRAGGRGGGWGGHCFYLYTSSCGCCISKLHACVGDVTFLSQHLWRRCGWCAALSHSGSSRFPKWADQSESALGQESEGDRRWEVVTGNDICRLGGQHRWRCSKLGMGLKKEKRSSLFPLWLILQFICFISGEVNLFLYFQTLSRKKLQTYSVTFLIMELFSRFLKLLCHFCINFNVNISMCIMYTEKSKLKLLHLFYSKNVPAASMQAVGSNKQKSFEMFMPMCCSTTRLI